jgi:hypothetical protein
LGRTGAPHLGQTVGGAPGATPGGAIAAAVPCCAAATGAPQLGQYSSPAGTTVPQTLQVVGFAAGALPGAGAEAALGAALVVPWMGDPHSGQ